MDRPNTPASDSAVPAPPADMRSELVTVLQETGFGCGLNLEALLGHWERIGEEL